MLTRSIFRDCCKTLYADLKDFIDVAPKIVKDFYRPDAYAHIDQTTYNAIHGTGSIGHFASLESNEIPAEKENNASTISKTSDKESSNEDNSNSEHNEPLNNSNIKNNRKYRRKKNLKESHSYNASYSTPWIDKSLKREVESNNKDGSLKTKIKMVTRKEVDKLIVEAGNSYITRSKPVNKNLLHLIAVAGIRAAKDMGLLVEGAAKLTTKEIYKSVDELSKSTNSGSPFLTKKNSEEQFYDAASEKEVKGIAKATKCRLRELFRRPTKRKVIACNKQIPVELPNSKRALFNLPEVIFLRFQVKEKPVEGKDDISSRIVWCVPFDFVSLENIFMGKLFDRVKDYMYASGDPLYPVKLTNQQIGVRCTEKMRDKFKKFGKGRKLFSLDWSKFDRTIPSFAKDIFFAIIRSQLQLTSNEETVFNYMRMYIKFTPFLYGGNLYFKQKGISSGMFLTNMFDTWWNLTLQYVTDILYYEYPETAKLIRSREADIYNLPDSFMDLDPNSGFRFDSCKVMGDDTLTLATESKILLLKSLAFYLGMKVDVKNVTNDAREDIFFLGRFWDTDGIPNQSFDYMYRHIVLRTKKYKESELPFSLDELDLQRILSICLPLKDGKKFLDKYFKNYKPYQDWLQSEDSFWLLKDWPYDEYIEIRKEEAFNPLNM